VKAEHIHVIVELPSSTPGSSFLAPAVLTSAALTSVGSPGAVSVASSGTSLAAALGAATVASSAASVASTSTSSRASSGRKIRYSDNVSLRSALTNFGFGGTLEAMPLFEPGQLSVPSNSAALKLCVGTLRKALEYFGTPTDKNEAVRREFISP